MRLSHGDVAFLSRLFGGFLSAKGDLLSIAPQGLLLDLGPLISWP